MPTAPTVFEEPRSNLVGLPIFIGAVCLLAVGSVVLRGIPPDTQTRAAVGVMAAIAVACVFWALRWRTIRLATLAIDHEAIVMTPRGRKPQPRRIVRRPDSRLQVKISSSGTASPTAVSVYVLFDEVAGQPRLPIDNFGVERVKQACVRHGWVMADHKPG